MYLNRWTFVGALIACIVFVGYALASLLPNEPCPGPTKANFDRIQDGMAHKDVEAILGKNSDVFLVSFGRWRSTTDIMSVLIWKRDDGAAILIDYGPRDNVVGKTWVDSNETICQKINRWLHLPK